MTDFNFAFPIDMIKREQRIVVGIATADNVDKSGDIVDFEASKEAFANWGGNIREMHSPIAVGKAVSYEPVTIEGENGTIYNGFKVEAYISKGAEDTWQKVLDGTLRSFSIGGKIVSREESSEKFFRGKPVSIIKEYVLGELSLVDNPANALAIIDIVKIDGEGLLKYALNCDLDCQLAKAKHCGCGSCENITKDGLGAGGGAPAVSVTTDNAESKNPSQGKFKTPTMANSPSGYPKFKPKKKKKKEKNMNNEDPINKDATDGEGGIIPALQNLMANSVIFYASAHRAHWNVEGEDFVQYHELFGRIYIDAYNAIDPLAENIRKLKAFPPSLSDAEDIADYEDDSDTSDAQMLALDLYYKNMQLVSILKETFDVASSANEQGVANFIAERIDAHQLNDWQLSSMLKSSGVVIPPLVPEDETDSPETQDGGPSATQVMSMLNQVFTNATKSFIYNKTNVENFDILKKEDKTMESIIQQDAELQLNNTYDKISNMNEQDINRLSLVKKFINWLVPDVEEKASNTIEVIGNTQEEEMDINVLKDALSAVVDEKLASFATSIKEEVEASVQEKLETVAKGFEAQNAELQQKLEVTEIALAEQTEKVDAFAVAGAVKKSVDPEDDEEEGEALAKSANVSFWKNAYLPQELINSLGYRS